MRRLAEGAAKLPAEVRHGEVRCAGESGDVERLAVSRVGEILRAEQVPGRGDRAVHRLASDFVAEVGHER